MQESSSFSSVTLCSENNVCALCMLKHTSREKLLFFLTMVKVDKLQYLEHSILLSWLKFSHGY